MPRSCVQINMLGLTPNRYYPALTSGRFVITNLAGVTASITTDTLGLGLLGNQRLFDVSSFYLTGIFTDHDLLMVGRSTDRWCLHNLHQHPVVHTTMRICHLLHSQSCTAMADLHPSYCQACQCEWMHAPT